MERVATLCKGKRKHFVTHWQEGWDEAHLAIEMSFMNSFEICFVPNVAYHRNTQFASLVGGRGLLYFVQ